MTTDHPVDEAREAGSAAPNCCAALRGAMSIHIYTASMQPYTKYVDNTFDPPLECSTPAGRLVYCECCGKRRFARDVVVQCLYDGRRLWCAPDRGCKNPQLLEAARRREFRNRSKGQKRRWDAVRSNA